MLPNKIYAGFDENIHLESYCLEKKGRCQTEYIRKDVLLDWVTERMGRLEALFKIAPSSAIAGKYDAMKELIEKIESL